jgi:pimeloyl-ACP methyl ester carboxylesterase
MSGWRRSFWLSLILGWSGLAHAGDSDPQKTPMQQPQIAASLPNIKVKTLGGVQFWGDVSFFHGWHIQHNTFTGHYRLLDGNDVRHAWGTREHCEAKLLQIRTDEKLPALPKTAVVLLHGLARSDKSVSRLKRHFEKAGYYTIAMNYPSLRASVQENAEYLHEVLESLEGVEEIHLVGFSMGGIVVRQCLAAHEEPRLGRVVLIGTPNQGAELATLLKDWWAYKQIVGPAGQDLATAPHGLAPKLPAPRCEFGIIAGCRGTDGGYNPLIPGDNDGTVSLETTRLEGARDFMTVRGIHQVLLHTPAVLTAAEHFIAHGQFHADRDPEPILASSEKDSAAVIEKTANSDAADPVPRDGAPAQKKSSGAD